MMKIMQNIILMERNVDYYLVLRPWRSVERLSIKSLHVIKFHDSVVILTPPSLRLPFIKHLSASNSNAKYCQSLLLQDNLSSQQLKTPIHFV